MVCHEEEGGRIPRTPLLLRLRTKKQPFSHRGDWSQSETDRIQGCSLPIPAAKNPPSLATVATDWMREITHSCDLRDAGEFLKLKVVYTQYDL